MPERYFRSNTGHSYVVEKSSKLSALTARRLDRRKGASSSKGGNKDGNELHGERRVDSVNSWLSTFARIRHFKESIFGLCFRVFDMLQAIGWQTDALTQVVGGR